MTRNQISGGFFFTLDTWPARQPGHATWSCHMVIPHGHITWSCHMDTPHGHTTWSCHTTWSYNMVIQHGHATRSSPGYRVQIHRVSCISPPTCPLHALQFRRIFFELLHTRTICRCSAWSVFRFRTSLTTTVNCFVDKFLETPPHRACCTYAVPTLVGNRASH